MVTAEVLAEEEVSIPNLDRVFRRAYMKTELEDGGERLKVYADAGARVTLRVERDTRLLKLGSAYRFRESSSLESRLAFVNKMNDTIIMVRFSVPERKPEVLYADYFLPFEEGVFSFQVVSAMRLFARVAVSAITRFDDGDIVA